ncbi:hypothetical protein D9M73_141740 [compost metagenome]
MLHAVVHFAVIHAGHCLHTGWRQHAALLHLQHFLLVPGVQCRIPQVELMQQLAFIDQHEAHGFPGLDIEGLRREGHVPHHHLDAAGRLGRRGRLTEIVGTSGVCPHR